jgi:hypothetical protein
MNDAEIIKALECCCTTKGGGCKECPLNDYEDTDVCQLKVTTEAYKLIQRQQAEIEKLKKIQQRQADLILEERGRRYELSSRFTTAKSEAIREFAKELIINLDGDIEAYANAGHGLNVYEWLVSYLNSKGAIENEHWEQ